MYCKDCKYFQPHRYEHPILKEEGRGDCKSMKLQSDDKDGLDWWECAELSVGPEFGCIHWGQKE